MNPLHLLLVSALLLPALSHANGEELLSRYRAQGAGPFDAERGRQVWQREMPAAKDASRSCTSCHGSDPTQAGKHTRTGKPIEPMAPRVEPARLGDPKKVEKWFLRNCKWTWGRACTAQEKGDIIAYLNNL